MSNRKLIDPSIVTGIADAIRTKKGTTATIKVSELADEIASIPTGGMADSTKELVQVVSGVTPTDEISLNNGIASGVVDTPSVQSWSGTRTTADGGTIKDGIAYIKAIRGKSVVVDGNVLNCKQKSVISKDADGQTLDTLTLPTLTAFPHGLCGVGTAYDEVSLAEGKATKRIGCVDLGTRSWQYRNAWIGEMTFDTSISDMKKVATSVIPNDVTAKYKTVKLASATGESVDGVIFQGGSNTILIIKDSSFTSAAAFKSAMSGVMLYYELATAEESTFTPCRAYYKASNNGQEVATADTATAPFTAEIGYKEPTATELANVLNG